MRGLLSGILSRNMASRDVGVGWEVVVVAC